MVSLYNLAFGRGEFSGINFTNFTGMQHLFGAPPAGHDTAARRAGVCHDYVGAQAGDWLQVQFRIIIRGNARRGSVKVRLDKSLKPRPRERVRKSALRKPLKRDHGLKFSSRAARARELKCMSAKTCKSSTHILYPSLMPPS